MSSAARLLIATAGAVVALAFGGTLAAATVLNDSQDSHGDAVSAAAHDCRASAARTAIASGARNHGPCVRVVAMSNAHRENDNDSDEANDSHGDAVSKIAHTAPHSPAGAHGDAVSAVAKNHPSH